MVRTVRNVRILSDTYVHIRKQKDWGSNPCFANLNPSFSKWIEDLPPDMQIHYPPDGSPPWLPSHFVGNMHCYYHLSIILLHRPQLMSSSSFAAGGSWKQHMATCYDSAKRLCRIQEALYQTYELDGIISAQRGMLCPCHSIQSRLTFPLGINFAIYCILSCTMIHLVCLSPDLSTMAKSD